MNSQDPTAPPPLRRFVFPFIFVAALFIALYMRRPEPSPPVEVETVWELAGKAMGTGYIVKVIPGDNVPETEAPVVAKAADAAIQRVNQYLSTYSDTSEISVFNRMRSTESVKISADFSTVLTASLSLFEKTGGAFDVTVGPLVNLWGFGPGDKDKVPTEQEIADARSRMGSQLLKLSDSDTRLAKTKESVYVDLSAIAKGYGVDQMGAAIRSQGYDRFLVEVGGEVLVSGAGPNGKAWTIGLERPDGGAQDIETTIQLKGALATSGNYRNFRKVNGVRIGHTIDPRTGGFVTHETASVSVVMPSCMEADGWATSMMVLGEKEGLAVAEKYGVAARFLVADGEDGFVAVASSQWNTLFPQKRDETRDSSEYAPQREKD